MLCPEVWTFPYTKNNISVDVGVVTKKSEQFLSKLIEKHPYNEVLSIAIAEEETVPEELSNILNASFFYLVKDFKLCDIVQKDFIEAFIKRGKLTALSVVEFNEIDDIFAITPDGVLVLSVNKDLYQSLGLEGKLHCCFSRKKDRYNISSSKLIGNNSIKYLLDFHHLRKVQLYRTSVTIDGYIRLLTKMPQLEDLGRYDAIGACLEYIDMTFDDSDDKPNIKLKSFETHYVVTKHLKLLAKWCPNIEKVCLFHNALLNDLTGLIAINKLKDLRLLSCNFYLDHVRDVLEVKGCNLTYLHLEHVDEIDINALMSISQYCPDLTTLVIYNCELVESHLKYFRKSIPPFMNLERLTIAAQCDTQHMEFLLTNCYKIKFIHIGTMVPTNDELFNQTLSNNPMEHLEELHITYSTGLTVSTAYKLIETCDNLRILNELENWTRVQELELKSFRNFLKSQNYDIDIKVSRWKPNMGDVF